MQKSLRYAAAMFAAVAGLGVAAMSGSGASPEDVRVVKGSSVGKTSTDKAPSQRATSRSVEIITNRLAFGGGRAGWNSPKPGYSVRQGQRMALKRRNRSRNKAAHRG